RCGHSDRRGGHPQRRRIEGGDRRPSARPERHLERHPPRPDDERSRRHPRQRTVDVTERRCSRYCGSLGGWWVERVMLKAALRDLQWRGKRFVIAMVGVSLVFAMGLIMTGLTASFSIETNRTLESIGAERWAVA